MACPEVGILPDLFAEQLAEMGGDTHACVLGALGTDALEGNTLSR